MVMFTRAIALGALTLAACAAPVEPNETHASESVSTSTEALVSPFTPRFTPRLDALGKLPIADLETLYQSGTTDGGMPTGKGEGRAFFLGLPGLTALDDQLRLAGIPTFITAEDLIANGVWQGKTIDVAGGEGGKIGTLSNMVLGLDLASADVYRIDASNDADERNTYYLDYSRSDFPIVRGVQDYIRRIDDALYLGKAFLKVPGGTRVLACYFALDFGS